MDGLLGVAGMIITGDYGSFPHSLLNLLSTSKNIPKLFFDDNSLGLYSYTWDYTIWLFNIAMENHHF